MDNFIIANKTDVGRARQVNEDNLVTFDSPNGRVVAVCDGMGGQAAGDLASEIACNIIRDILENNTFATPGEAITKAIMAANQGILHRASQDPNLMGMGSTCVMLIIKDGVVHYGWVGDSRIYYISNHNIVQISKDQSYVQTLVDSGQITQEEAEHHERKNEITNALGYQYMTPPMLCQMPLKPEPDSVILLCSDGLSGMIDNASIERTVSRKELSLQERADILVDKANENGGYDNITVQLVEFSQTNAGGTAYDGEAMPMDTYGNKNKTIMYAVIALVAVAIIAAAAYFFLGGKEEPKNSPVKNEQKNQDTRTKPVVSQEKVNKPSETVKVDITSKKKDVRSNKSNSNIEDKITGKTEKTRKGKNGIGGITGPSGTGSTGNGTTDTNPPTYTGDGNN